MTDEKPKKMKNVYLSLILLFNSGQNDSDSAFIELEKVQSNQCFIHSLFLLATEYWFFI